MDERKNNLLKVIVETYIKTVRPVGSKALCDMFNLSSATIRNEMALLEEMGYLEKNHISSGRIPSEEGYKYYVRNLMEPEKLTGSEMLQLQKIFANTDIELSDAINKCMDIISDITNYTSVVLGKSSSDNTLLQINIIDLGNNQVVAVVCTDKGNVENKMFTLPNTINVKEVIKTSEIINKMLVGTPINEVSKRLELEVKPIIKTQIQQYETVYNIFYNAFNDFVATNSNIHVTGKTKIFEQPEYSDITELKRLANKLEDKSLITKMEENIITLSFDIITYNEAIQELMVEIETKKTTNPKVLEDINELIKRKYDLKTTKQSKYQRGIELTKLAILTRKHL